MVTKYEVKHFIGGIPPQVNILPLVEHVEMVYGGLANWTELSDTDEVLPEIEIMYCLLVRGILKSKNLGELERNILDVVSLTKDLIVRFNLKYLN